MTSDPGESPINIAALLQSISAMQPQDLDQTVDANKAVGGILRSAAYGSIPAQAAEAISGLEIFEDSDNPGSWFWEWEWGECQDGPYGNELEALIAFATFASELAVELSNEEEDE